MTKNFAKTLIFDAKRFNFAKRSFLTIKCLVFTSFLNIFRPLRVYLGRSFSDFKIQKSEVKRSIYDEKNSLQSTFFYFGSFLTILVFTSFQIFLVGVKIFILFTYSLKKWNVWGQRRHFDRKNLQKVLLFAILTFFDHKNALFWHRFEYFWPA